MNDEADDLPVLTEVLRIGQRSRSRFDAQGSPIVPGVLAPGLLVVGHDAQANLEPYGDVPGMATPDPLDLPTEPFAPIEDRAPPAPLGVHRFFDEAPGPVPVSVEHGDGGAALDGKPVDVDAATLESLRAALREEVLTDLSSRIDSELDARVAQALHSEIEVALAHLQEGLREQLASGLRDVVRRAVDEQLGRRRDIGPVEPSG